MPSDPCMFCSEHPCKCAGKRTAGLGRKPRPKSEPVAPESKPDKPKPIKRQPSEPKPVRPAPTLRRDAALDPELREVLRTFDYFDMLHPDERVKYEQYLFVTKTTGRLVADERANLEHEQGSVSDHRLDGKKGGPDGDEYEA